MLQTFSVRRLFRSDQPQLKTKTESGWINKPVPWVLHRLLHRSTCSHALDDS